MYAVYVGAGILENLQKPPFSIYKSYDTYF